MKKNKKVTIMVCLLSVLILGVTYAYLKIGGNLSSSTDLQISASTVDELTFKMGNEINLSINQFNFGKEAGNISAKTTAQAIFKATNSSKIAKSTGRYNIYLIIENNDFEYTTSDAKPEILLNITDPNGNKVENITGLVNTENGFDITTRTGGFLIVADYDIEATRGNTTTQEWNVEVTFVNLETNQIKNQNKSLSAKLYMTKDKMSSYELAKINNLTPTISYNTINVVPNVIAGTSEIATYLFGIKKASSAETDIEYTETKNTDYTFTNLEANTLYDIFCYAIDKNGVKSNIYQTQSTTKEYHAPKINSVTHSTTYDSVTLSVSATKGDNDIVKYYYSKDNGATYEESTSNTYIFSNLTDTTEYKIKIKVEDSQGFFSTEYYETIATEIYILPSVTKAEATTKYNQISITTEAIKGTNNISKYYYSIDGKDYIEGSQSYTFTGLSENTTHTIKVKVADTIGRTSNEYTLTATTDAYILPSITTVNTTNTFNSITINVETQNGTGTVNKYYYSKDDGSNYTESTSNSYTFSDLTSSATYYIKVKVADSNGKQSTIYSTTVTTSEKPILTCQNPTISKTYDDTPLTVTNYPVEYFFDYYTISDNSPVHKIKYDYTPEFEYIPNSNQTVTLPGSQTQVGNSRGGEITLTFANGLSCTMTVTLLVEVPTGPTPGQPVTPSNPNLPSNAASS